MESRKGRSLIEGIEEGDEVKRDREIGSLL
jgi:hypothetical protein